MRKPYVPKKGNTEFKQEQLLRIEEYGILPHQYRKIYKQIKNQWQVVSLGCMKCARSYTSLLPIINHINGCKQREINTLTEEEENAHT